ncbi:MAG: radical SAM protein [Bacteroidales bacterium]|nr:radical SAM protein [Bacteroidales bacterium]
MELSRHNILSRIHRSDDYFLVNVLSGNADILTSGEAERVMNGRIIDDPEYISKGYVVDPAQEEKLFRSKYLDFIDARETDEIQLFYAPTYSCNFNCSYCYQEGYANQTGGNSPEVADAFFRYILDHFKGRRKYVTLFGGEPLLNSQQNKNFLEFFIGQCRKAGLELAVVTNGYNLHEFIPLLSQTGIREIQVTLDGPEKVHNERRPLKGGQGTFIQIVRGIDAALEAKLPVNLRVVLDRDNMASLPDLARYAIDKGWT